MNKNAKLAAAIILLLAGLAYFLEPSITGLITRQYVHSEDLNLVVTSNGTYGWVPKYFGDIEYIKLDGSMTKQGYAKVYLESDGRRYLVFDSTVLSGSNDTNLITAFAIDESQAQESVEIVNETADETGKSISIGLNYNAGTLYDEDDNGQESLSGVVDLAISAQFNWNVDESKLCTLWGIENIADEKLTKTCNGNMDCCALSGILPTSENWSFAYYSTFGKEDAGYSNIISAQVMYYSANLDLESPKLEIINSSLESLPVKFFNEEVDFENQCTDTCQILLNKSPYRLVFEVGDNTILRIDKIKYRTLLVENNVPELIRNITVVNVPVNGNASINLSEYFSDPDGDLLSYSNYGIENVSIEYKDGFAMFRPSEDFEGLRYTYIVANDSDEFVLSDVFAVNVSLHKIKPKVEIGKRVKWVETIRVEDGTLNISLPGSAFNITIKDEFGIEIEKQKIRIIEDGKIKDKDAFEEERRLEGIERKISLLEEAIEKDAKVIDETAKDLEEDLNDLYRSKSRIEGKKKSAITGNVAVGFSEDSSGTEIIVENATKTIYIEYETEAPIAIEEDIAGGKHIKIVSETHYEDVLAYTSLNEVPQSSIKLYWISDGERILFEDVSYIDGNLNGLIDRIQWIIPHLSNQTFEVSITVLNVQSYPTVNGNWTVTFNTSGTGNLTISAVSQTTYAEYYDDNSSTIDDLDILELKCGSEILFSKYDLIEGAYVDLVAENGSKVQLYETIGNEIKIKSLYAENYNCDNKTGYWTVKVLTEGVHDQQFNFSGQVAEAHNFASASNVTTNGSIYQFIDDTDSEFGRGNTSGTRVLGSGSSANVSSNVSSLNNQTLNMIGRSVVPNASLVLYLKFEEGQGQYANDSSIYGNNGTLGATSASQASDPVWNSTTKFGSFGLTFNGSLHYVNVTSTESLNFGNFTDFSVEAWIKWQSSGVSQDIVSKQEGVTSPGAPIGWQFRLVGPSNKLYFGIYDDVDEPVVNSLEALRANEWYHVAAVADRDGNISVFVNGVQTVGPNISAVGNVSHNDPLLIGAALSPGVALFFNGTIDEVRVWNVTLDNTTISRHYQLGWGYYNKSNFTSQVFDAGKKVNYTSIAWQTANDYGNDLGNLINASTVLYLKFDNATGESERQLNETYDIANEPNLVLYMPFDSGMEYEVSSNGSTVLLLHFNNDTATGENATLFLNNATYANGTKLGNATCSFGESQCPVYNMTNGKFGAGIDLDGVNDRINVTASTSYAFGNRGFAIEAWIKPRHTSITGQNEIWGWRDDGVVGNFNEFRLLPNGVLEWNSVQCGGSVTSPVGTIQERLWQHVAVVREGNSFNLYHNGINVGSLSSSCTFSSAAQLPTIFNWFSGADSTFNGTVDDLAVWNITLTSEIMVRRAGYGIDKSRYGNNMTLLNGSAANLSGKFAEAMEFGRYRGRNYVSCKDSECGGKGKLDINESGGASFGAWVKVASDDGATRTIIGKQSQAGYKLRYSETDGQYDVITGNSACDNAGSSVSGGSVMVGQWQHVMATMTPTQPATLTLYVDGVPVASGGSQYYCDTNADFIVGAATNSGSQNFNGSIDEVSVWNITLSADKVAEFAGSKLLDYSRYGNNGTRNFNSTSDFGRNFTTGKFSKALVFDGINDYVNVSNHSSLKPRSALTVEGWIKANGVPEQYTPIFGMTGASDPYGGYLLNVQNGFRLSLQANIGGTWDNNLVGSSSLIPNQWYHVVGTYDGSKLKLYVNGVLDGSRSNSGQINYINGLDLVLGHSGDQPNLYFNGTLDELSIWNISLSEDEIRRHYERGVLRLNLSYRTSNDNATWTGWVPAANGTFAQPNLVSRYFQYKVEFNTSDARFTPILNNVSINFSIGSNLSIFDATESRIVIANEYFNFTANFTDGKDPINGTSVNCTISINSSRGYEAPIAMNYSAQNKYYYHEAFFSNRTLGYFNVTCDGNALGFAITKAVDMFNVSAARLNNFNGSTTNIEGLSSFDNVNNFVLELAPYAKIEWKNPVNITAMDFNRHANLSQNFAGILNSHSSLNSSANITIYDVNLVIPSVLKDNAVCPNNLCTIAGYNGNNLSFNVSSFSNFSASNGTLNISISLNATLVLASSPIAVSGFVNLSNGSNYTNGKIRIFIDDDEVDSSSALTDDSGSDFGSGNLSLNGKIAGSGSGANLTINISSLQNQTQNLFGRGIVANSSLVLYLRFEEGTGQYANDSGIYGNNATLGNTTAAKADDPVWNSSAKFGSFGLGFDGDDDYINTTLRLNYSSGITFESWIKVDPSTNNMFLYGDVNSAAGSQLNKQANGTLRFNVYDGAEILLFSTTRAISNDTWHHIAATWDGTTNANGAKIFIDGVQSASATATAAMPKISECSIRIGVTVGGSCAVRTDALEVDGVMDEVRIWNISLTNETILEHYQKGWGYFNTSNFTSRILDAGRLTNFTSIVVSQNADDKGRSNLYQSDIGDLVNASTVLYMKFDNATEESERQLNVTHNILNEVNLVLYMPFDSSQAQPLTANSSTMILLRFDNETSLGENSTFFKDNSSYRNNGTCGKGANGCPSINSTFYRFGNGSIVFNGGGSDFINVTNSKTINITGSTDFSAEFWFYAKDGNDQTQTFMSKWDSGTGFELDWNSAGDLYCWIGTGSGNEVRIPTSSVTANQWHHYACTYNHANIKLYIDGAERASKALTSDMSSNSADLTVGTLNANTAAYGFNGTLDEVAVWNISLTPEIIAKHAGYGIDKSRYGNNATLMNGSLINVSGKFAEAMEFGRYHGTNYVEVVNKSALGQAFNVTAEAWVKLAGRGATTNWGPTIMTPGLNECSTAGYTLNIYNSAFTFIPGNGNNDQIIGSGIVPNLDEWYHVTGTSNGSVAKIYVNGVFMNSSSSLGVLRQSPCPLWIGGEFQRAGRFWNGSIDEVAVWNVSLSSDKISEHAGAKVLDYSMYKNNGSRFSNTSSDFGRNFTTGKFNRALVFDGVNDYVNVSSPSGMPDGARARSQFAWVYISSYPSQSQDSALIQGYGDVNTDKQSQLVVNYQGYLRLRVVGSNDLTSSLIVPTGGWHHVGFTYNGGTPVTFYLDGIRQTLSAAQALSTAAGGIMYIGGGAQNLPFTGRIDEVSVWNISLSEEDIRRHYERGVLRLNLSYRTSADNIIWSNWTGVNNNSNSEIDEVARYFQYKVEFNTTDPRYTPILNNVSAIFSGIFTNSYGRYNYTITAPSAGGTYTAKANLTFEGINSQNYETFRVGFVPPSVNANYTSPVYPRFNRNVTLVINATDQDDTIVYVNFTLTAPNGTKVINNTNGTRGSGDLYNTAFNLTSYGTWKWNASVYDIDGFILNTATLDIILMQATINLSTPTVLSGDSVTFSGKINLSNGTNVSDINIFLDEAQMGMNNLTPQGTYKSRQLADDSSSDFNRSVNINATKIHGTGIGANVTLADWDYDPDGNLSVGLVAYWKFDEGTGSGNRSNYVAGPAIVKNDLATNSTITRVDGIREGAVNLTKSKVQFLNTSDNANLSMGDIDFTISLWAYTDDVTSADQQMLGKYDGSSIEYWMKVDRGERAFELCARDTTDTSSTCLQATSNPRILNRTWYYILAWHDSIGNQLCLAVNDLSVNCTSWTGGVRDGNLPFVIGMRGDNTQHWGGRFDEIGIWKRLLTQKERFMLYNATNSSANSYLAGNTYKPYKGNFTSQAFDAGHIVNWNSISWQEPTNYNEDLANLINSSTVLYMKFDNHTLESERPLNESYNVSNERNLVLYMKFNNETGESERQLNETHNIANEPNLVLYMPFDSYASELRPNGSTVLLMHFNNDTITGENASLFLNNATFGNGTGIVNASCAGATCPVFNMSNSRLGDAGLEFDGSNDFVNVSYSNALNVTPGNAVTLEAWIKPGSLTDTGNIVSNGPFDRTGYRIYINSADNSIGYQFTIGGTVVQADTTGIANSREWTHVAATFDGTNIRIYLNGAHIYSRTNSGTIGTSSNGTTIGTNTNSNRFFRGTIDEVAIWNISLSSEVIAKHAGYGIDRSIYGNNATLVNGSTVNFTNKKFGEAMELDGKGDIVNISDSASLQNIFDGGGTILAWIYPRSSGGNGIGRILDKDRGDEGTGWIFATTAQSGNRMKLRFLKYFSGTDLDVTTTNADVILNEFSHVALVYNSSSTANDPAIYVNGVKVAVLDASPTGASNDDASIELAIGGEGDFQRMFNGTLDEVAIWNVSLAPDKVSEHAGAKVLDYSMYKNNGSRFSNTTSGFGRNFTTGKFSKALVFDGINDFVNISDNPSLDAVSAVTIGAWINPRSIPATGTFEIAGKQYAGDTDGSYHLSMHLNGFMFRTFTGSAQEINTANSIPKTNEWQHVAGVYDGSIMTIYINGVPIKSIAQTGNLVNSADQFIIGGRPHLASPTAFFNGSIDEVFVYNVSLSKDKIAEIAGAKTLDYSIYGNNGSRFTNSSPDNGRNFTTGKFSKALVFDGVNDYVNVSNHSSLKPRSGLTVEGWIKANGIPDQYTPIFGMTGGSDPYGGYLLNVQSGFKLSLQANIGGTWDNNLIGATSLVSNQWYYVAGTYDGSQLRLYVNGILDGTRANSGQISYINGLDLVLGHSGDQPNLYFNGTIDELAIWNISLDADTIKSHYERGVLKLNLSYRLSNDSTIWSQWINARNSTSTQTEGLARYFQYNANFNTTDARFTPIINNVTVNYTGVFTNSYGEYSYSFQTSGLGSYTVKANSTWAGAISGEALVSLSVEENTPPNAPVINAPAAGEFININYTMLNITLSDNNTLPQVFSCYIYAGNSTLPNTTINSSSGITQNGTTITYNWTNLNNTVYYWKANCEDGNFYGENSTIRNFTIDTISPGINFTATLSSGAIVNKDYIMANITTSEINFANVTFYLWNSSTLALYNETNFSSRTLYVNFTNLNSKEKSYIINATVRDRAGNINSTESRNITLDLLPPRNISFTSPTPANSSRAKGNLQKINITITDIEVSSCVLQVYNGTNSTNYTMEIRELNCNVTINTQDGYNYTLKAFVNDSALNLNESGNLTFRENTAPQAPALISPQNGSSIGSASVLLNFTSNDSDSDALYYIVYFGTSPNPANEVYRGLTPSYTATASSDGTYYWKVQADDTYENSSNSSVFQFIADLEEQEQEPSPGGGGGGGGGSSGGGGGSAIIEEKQEIEKKGEFIVSTNMIREKVILDSSMTLEIIVKNIGDVQMDFEAGIDSISRFVEISERSFSLGPGEEKVLSIRIDGVQSGSYLGSLVIKSGSIEKKINIILDIRPKGSLFDAKIDVPADYREIYAGEDLRAQITLLNVLPPEKVDVTATYIIKDRLGRVWYESSETFAVDEQASFSKSFNIPSKVTPGDYLAALEIRYQNSFAVSSDIFTVLPASYAKNTWKNAMIAAVVLLAVLTALIFTIRIRRR